MPAAALAAARAGGSGFGGALLLATRNSSWPVEPDAGEDDASLAAGRSRLPALLGLSPPSPPPPPPLGIASASPPGAAANTSLAATTGAGGGAGATATDAQARAFASLHGVTRREERPGVRFAEEHLFPTLQGAAAEEHGVEHGAGHGAGRDASLEPDESAEEVRHTQAKGGGGHAMRMPHICHAHATCHMPHAACRMPHAACQGPAVEEPSSSASLSSREMAARSDALEELLLRAAQRRASAQGRLLHVDTPRPRSTSSCQRPWQPDLLWPTFSGGPTRLCAALGRGLGRSFRRSLRGALRRVQRPASTPTLTPPLTPILTRQPARRVRGRDHRPLPRNGYRGHRRLVPLQLPLGAGHPHPGRRALPPFRIHHGLRHLLSNLSSQPEAELLGAAAATVLRSRAATGRTLRGESTQDVVTH